MFLPIPRQVAILLSSILLLGMASTLHAQVKKGFKLLEKGNYTEAITAFEAEKDQAEHAIAIQYGIMKAHVSLSDYNAWVADIAAWSTLDASFRKLLSKDKADLNDDFGINSGSIGKLRDLLYKNAVSLLEKEGTEAQVNALVAAEAKPLASYKSRIDKLKAKWAKPVPKPEPAPKPTPVTTEKPAPKPLVIQAVDREVPQGSKMTFIKNINSKYEEYLPVLTVDGKTLYFTSSDRPDGGIGEDVFYSERQADGSWGVPKHEPRLSSSSNDGVISSTADGNSLILFRNGAPYLVHRTAGGWSEPEPIDLGSDFPWIGITTISRNGEAIVFEARSGGSSQIDLYVALRQSGGKWGEPFKLGGNINTTEDDRAPFLHSDFKTMYYSSSGLTGGSGGMDMYKTIRLDNTWKKWSNPQNLGAEINTAGDDWGFCIPPSGEVAYMATNLPGFFDRDIVSVPLPQSARPEKQITVMGELKDKQGRGIEADITVEEAKSGEVLQQVRSQPNGSYSFVVPEKSEINFSAKADNSLPVTRFIDMKQYKTEVVEQKIEVISYKDAENGAALELGSVFFETGKSELLRGSTNELKRLYAEVKALGWQIDIAGHTDDIGEADLNLRLSEKRAQSVRNYLIKLGIPSNKVTATGYGDTRPKVPNDSEENRKINRRVEISIRK